MVAIARPHAKIVIARPPPVIRAHERDGRLPATKPRWRPARAQRESLCAIRCQQGKDRRQHGHGGCEPAHRWILASKDRNSSSCGNMLLSDIQCNRPGARATPLSRIWPKVVFWGRCMARPKRAADSLPNYPRGSTPPQAAPDGGPHLAGPLPRPRRASSPYAFSVSGVAKPRRKCRRCPRQVLANSRVVPDRRAPSRPSGQNHS